MDPGAEPAADDELIACLQHSVDSRSFTRGRAYAEEGKVLDLDWVTPGSHLEGSVQGSKDEVYDTSAEIVRGPDGSPESIDGFCTCPVRRRCKHMVGLVLAALAHQQLIEHQVPTITSSGTTVARAPWEVLLGGVVAEDHDEPGTDGEGLGLLVDVVTDAVRLGTTQSVGQPRLRLRPVMRDGAKGWSTRGISWKTLDGLRWNHRAHPEIDAQVFVLKELRALAHLNEASGSEAVTLHRHPAEGVVDVRHTAKGLTLTPTLVVDDAEIELERSRLLGPRPYAIAFWGEDLATGAVDDLHLARLGEDLDPTVLELLRTPKIVIPDDESARFLEGYAPDLAERLHLVSSDGSVTFPDPKARHLLLSIDPLGSDHLHLAWDWIRPGSRPTRRGTLIASASSPVDEAAEVALMDRVLELIDGWSGLVDEGPRGARLTASALVSGSAMFDFLTDLLPALDVIEGVEIENIGEVPGYRAAVNAPVITLGGEASQDWFDLQVTVSVDGEDVAFKDLFVALAEGQEFMVLPSGTFFPLDSPELAQLAALIAEGRALWAGAAGTVRVGKLQASWWEEVASLGILDAQAAAWQESLAGLLSATDPIAYEVPSGIDATLRPYQVDGFRWLAHLETHGLGGILADDMGLGKTLQALALMVHLNERNPAAPPFLVVAPTSVVGNWASETHRFAPGLRVVTIAEGVAKRGTDLASVIGDADIVITSYGLFRREFEAYESVTWSGLFLDEAQFVKNPTSQASRRARMLSVPFKVAITGTPMENNLLELWSLFAICAPGLLGSTERFKKHYAAPIEKRQDAERLVELRNRIRPFMLRRAKEVVAAELPEKTEQVLEVELSPKHRKVYDTYLHRERSKVLGLLDDMDGNRFEIFRSLTLLRQAALDVGLIDAAHAGVASTKLELLAEMVEDVVAEGHKVLIFSQFTRFLRSATAIIESLGIPVSYLDGTTKDRQGAIQEFREGDAQVFLISLKAGGFGLNLTEADYCILLDPWWNPATEAQAVDRAHRIGQTKNVMVYRLVAKDTIEEKVMAMKAKKAALFDDVINSGELSQGGLSAQDIRSLLS